MKTRVLFSVLILLSLSLPFGSREVKAGSSDNIYGWAWSSNIGWISFNCTNSELPGPLCSAPYGVNVDPSTGNFSGYAWSENIGWIWFAPADATPVKLNQATNEVSGWARACAGAANADCTGGPNPAAGGWDGWIGMSGIWAPGVTYDPATCEFSGFAWGSDVIGWINFNGPGYRVKTNLCGGEPPVVSGMSVTQGDYCLADFPIIFNWVFSDPDPGDDQNAFQVKVYDTEVYDEWGDPILILDSCDFPSGSCPPGNTCGTCEPGHSSQAYAPPSSVFAYGKTYEWGLQVWDKNGLTWMASEGGSSDFSTPPYAYPNPSFTWTPRWPDIGENITFQDTSVCADADGLCNSWAWDFNINVDTPCPPLPAIGVPGCGDGIADNDQDSNAQNPAYSYSVAGRYFVRLTVTDDLWRSCQTPSNIYVAVAPPLPRWLEIFPKP